MEAIGCAWVVFTCVWSVVVSSVPAVDSETCCVVVLIGTQCLQLMSHVGALCWAVASVLDPKRRPQSGRGSIPGLASTNVEGSNSVS
jgi:hypothetical protein